MIYKDIIQILAGHPLVKDITKWMNSGSKGLQLNGLQASGKGMMLSAIQQTSEAKMLVVMEDVCCIALSIIPLPEACNPLSCNPFESEFIHLVISFINGCAASICMMSL